MSVSGLCAVCGDNGAEYTCDRCGSLVCEQHYEPSVGFCIECAGEVSGGPGSADRPDSSDTYQF